MTAVTIALFAAVSAMLALQDDSSSESPVVAEYRIEPLPSPRVVTVEVVDAETGEPIEGARVTSLSSFLPLDAFEPMLSALLESDGVTAVTDARGRVDVPRGRAMVASVGKRYGWIEVGMTSSVVRVVLGEPSALTVEVVDANGRPAQGVALALSTGTWPTVQETNEEGRAVFEPLALLRLPTVDVTVLAPFDPPLTQSLRRGETAEASMRFELPPSAPLRVDLLGLERVAPDLLVRGALTVRSTDPASPCRMSVDGPEGLSFPFSFPHAGLDLHGEVQVSSNWGWATLDLTDRWEDGEERSVALRLAEPMSVSAHVVDGEALFREGHEVVLRTSHQDWSGGRPFRVTRVQAEPSGRVTGWLEGEHAVLLHEGATLEILLLDEAGVAVWRGEAPLEQTAEHRFQAAREIDLAQPELLVSGIVCDDAGVGLEGVRIRVDDARPIHLRALATSSGGVVAIGEVVSKADGTFAVFGEASVPLVAKATWPDPNSTYRLVDVSRQHRNKAFKPGARGVRIVLPRLGFVTGRFVGSSEALEGLGFGSTPRGVHRDPGSQSPEFALAMPAGVKTLRLVRTNAGGEVLRRFEQVPVQPGAVTHLGDIPVEPAQTLRLTVQGAGGAPVPEGLVLYPIWDDVAKRAANAVEAISSKWPRVHEGRLDGVPFQRGSFELVRQQLPEWVAVTVPGYDPVAVRAVDGERTVTLNAAPDVSLHLVLDPSCTLPEGRELVALVKPSIDDPHWFRFGGPVRNQSGKGLPANERTVLEPGREVPLLVPSGRAVVQVFVRDVGSKRVADRRRIAIEPDVIDVRPDAGPQVFRLTVDPQSLERALRKQ